MLRNLRFKDNWGLVLVILLSWWVVKPLSHQGFFSIHDETQVVRLQQMAEALSQGQFPVRWVAGLGYGYGYPLFNFYAPLPYYVGAFFILVGFNALIATKLMFITGILLSGVLMYFLARAVWGELGGVLSAILYQYAPYHAVNIYIRGAVGEFWAMAFLPLVFLGLYKLIAHLSFKWRWVILGGLGVTGVILSHNVTAMLLMGFILITILFVNIAVILKKKKLILMTNYYLLITLGLGLSAFFWLPALWEMRYTNVQSVIGGGADFRDHFLFLDQLWDSPWGFAGSAPGRADGMSFKIGKLHIIIAVLGTLSFSYLWKQKKITRTAALLHLAAGKAGCYIVTLLLFSIFMTTQSSRFIWEAIPSLAYAQYPWRFLVFIIFTVSFLGGAGVVLLQILTKKTTWSFLSKAVIWLLIILTIVVNAKYFRPQKFFPLTPEDYLSEENIKWKTSRISDEYLPKNFPVPERKEDIVKEKFVFEKGVLLLNQEIKAHQYQIRVDSSGENQLLVRTAYFPGWQILVDGKRSDFEVVNGQMKVILPIGEHQVVVKFARTPARILGEVISLISLALLLNLIIQTVKNKSYVKKEKS